MFLLKDWKPETMSSVTLTFDRFGCDCLAAESAVAGRCCSEVLRAAALHYLAELNTGRLATRVPSFARGKPTAPELEVGLELDPAVLERLSLEAERQGLEVERLLAHAALLYVAEVGAGRPAAPSLTLVD